MPNWHWRSTPLIKTDFHDDRALLHLASAFAAEAAEMLQHAGQLSRSIAARIVTSSNSRDNSNFHPPAGAALPQASGPSFTQLTESQVWPYRARRDSP